MRDILSSLLPVGFWPCKMNTSGGLYFGVFIWVWYPKNKTYFIDLVQLTDVSNDL
ncbi:MAG: hypothetical protein [Bacteriophage sp.]|nr:MAG: hypothetical protein [Bacteriophage sp.]